MHLQMERKMFPENVTNGDYIFHSVIFQRLQGRDDPLLEMKLLFTIDMQKIA